MYVIHTILPSLTVAYSEKLLFENVLNSMQKENVTP